MAARTVEERIAIIDEKLSKRKLILKFWRPKMQKLLHPVTMKTVMEKCKSLRPLSRGDRRKISVLKCDPKY